MWIKKFFVVLGLLIVAFFVLYNGVKFYQIIKLGRQATQDPNGTLLSILKANEQDAYTVGATQDAGLVPGIIRTNKSMGNVAIKAIEAGGDPNIETELGTSILGWAIRYQHNDLVTLLLHKGAHVNGHGAYSNSQAIPPPLYEAILGGNEDAFTMLIDQGASISIPLDNQGHTAFGYAVAEREVALVKALLDRHVDVNAVSNKFGASPLITAVASPEPASADERNQTVALLLNAGANINFQDQSGMTALGYAIFKLDFESPESTVQLLLNRGADPNIKNSVGRTPYDEALEYHKDNLARLMEPYLSNN